MIKSLNRPEIAKRFAKDFNLTYKQTEAILEETEKSIFNFLKERDQVRIHGFGTFYIATFKSHVIKQIRTKTPRIILEQKGIKFRPSPIFKDAIYQRVRKPQTPKAAELEQERTIEIKPIRATPKQPTPEAKPAEIRKPLVEFKPINIHPRVEKESIKAQITERWLKIARSPAAPKSPSELPREAMIVATLLRQIQNAGFNSINFVFSGEKYINIYVGKPRRQLSHLAHEIIEGFLDFVDIKEFKIPQERRIILTLNQTRNERIRLHIHSFPVNSGASIQIVIE